MNRIEATQEQNRIIREKFFTTNHTELARELGIKYSTLGRFAKRLGLKQTTPSNKISLSDDDYFYLVKHFKDTDNDELAFRLGVSESTLHRLARRFSLKKSKAFMKLKQEEAAKAAKYFNVKNGTYPPKGFAIPNREKGQFKPGRTESKAQKRRRLEKSHASRNRTLIDEKMRICMGLPQRTKIKLGRNPQQVSQRFRLKKNGYILDEANGIAYWNADTLRCPILESHPEKSFYEFRKQE